MKSFLYLHTNDLAASRHFYSELLGLEEFFGADDVVGYRIGTLQLTISLHADAAEVDGWARQLGWNGGDGSAPSWGIEVADDAFGPTVRRLRSHAVACRKDEPEWVGYWSCPVADPMGNTVEISAVGEAAWPQALGGSDPIR